MKKTLIAVFLMLLTACNQNVTKNDISNLNGYWEIEKVILTDGNKKNYTYNESFDYFRLVENKGFRKKVKPQLDGRFLVNDQFENFVITFENSKVYMNYKTPYASWKEEIETLTKEKLVLINATDSEYHYKKSTSVNIFGDGKTTE